MKDVVIAAYWNYYPPPDLLNHDLVKTVQAIVDTGARAWVLKDVPAPGFNAPRYVAFTALVHGDFEQLGITREQHQLAGRDMVTTFQQISRIDGATVLDPSPYFLNQKGLYGVVKDDQVLYIDGDHLTLEGSRLLTPLFEPIFSR